MYTYDWTDDVDVLRIRENETGHNPDSLDEQSLTRYQHQLMEIENQAERGLYTKRCKYF